MKAARCWLPVSRRLILLLAGLLAAGGCASAVATGRSAALDSVDLVAMTDSMAAELAGDARVQAAIAREGPLRIVVQPVENRLTAEVLPRGPAEAFTARLRALLSQQAPDRFTWVMNRAAWRRFRNRELDFDIGPPPESVNPRYALTATFSSLADEDRRRRTSYYLCVYELTDLQTRGLLWSGRYEVKKSVVKGFLD